MTVATFALWAASCAIPMPGVVGGPLEACGAVRGLQVRLREGLNDGPGSALLTCERAMLLVQDNAQDLHQPWTFIFTGGFPGLKMVGDHGVVAGAMTYPATRVIEVNVRHLDAIAHEVKHAYNYENGLPDHEDW